MGLIKKKIHVELRTVIDDDGEKELSIIKQNGEYVTKGKLEVVTFTDKSDVGEVNNFITIQAKKVNIKRTGNISMNQQFIEGKKTECLYRHPYGSFHLEINTLSITHEKLRNNKDGRVIIEYDMKINGEQSRYHHLTLTYGGEWK